MSAGENCWPSTTLSKPLTMVSAGSSAVTSTSRLNSSLTARAYSARFSRWKVRPPGCGERVAAASICCSNATAMSMSPVPSGRLDPAGGIMPTRSLRMIFSARPGSAVSRDASNDASDSPPALPRSLWQVAQYCFTVAVYAPASNAGAAGAGVAAAVRTGRGVAGVDAAGRGAGACGAGACPSPPRAARSAADTITVAAARPNRCMDRLLPARSRETVGCRT